MRLLWEDRAWEDYLYWQTQNKRILKRVNMLMILSIFSGLARVPVGAAVRSVYDGAFPQAVPCRGGRKDQRVCLHREVAGGAAECGPERRSGGWG